MKKWNNLVKAFELSEIKRNKRRKNRVKSFLLKIYLLLQKEIMHHFLREKKKNTIFYFMRYRKSFFLFKIWFFFQIFKKGVLFFSVYDLTICFFFSCIFQNARIKKIWEREMKNVKKKMKKKILLCFIGSEWKIYKC